MKSTDESTPAAPGSLHDVGGYHLHIHPTGQGSPTVVFEAGLNHNATDWRDIQPAVSSFTRACSYDRAGVGFSDPGPKPRTSRQIVSELHRLLHCAAIDPPYVLVGRSFGGYNALLYAITYPDEVVGIVLVDANHPDQEHHMDPTPPEELEDLNRNTEGVRINEDFFESGRQIREAGPLPDIPLVVISAALDRDPVWHKLQKDLPNLAPTGRGILAKNSGHNIHRDEPNIVIAAIRDVVLEARTKRQSQT